MPPPCVYLKMDLLGNTPETSHTDPPEFEGEIIFSSFSVPIITVYLDGRCYNQEGKFIGNIQFAGRNPHKDNEHL